jgi:hypothetical protein
VIGLVILALSTTEPQSPTVAVEYTELVHAIEKKRATLAVQYDNATSSDERAQIRQTARRFLFSAIREEILPRWLGTRWSFAGTTQTPRTGEIACGYLVTTVLRDAGFRLERAPLAQQPSELILKSLVREAQIRRFSNTPIDRFLESLEQWGEGFYLVGLDIHVGFITRDTTGTRFIHSSYTEPKVVLDEAAKESPILSASRYRVLAKLSTDDELVMKWLLGKRIRTLTR